MEGKILVTGFAPFNGMEKNPSFEAVRLLPEKLDGYRIIKAKLPVVFKKAGSLLLKIMREERPDAVICTGLASGRTEITPEVIAVNLRHARIPDNEGNKPYFEKISREGPDGIFTSLPVDRMVQTLQAAGIPANLSFSAGSFVCNEVMYQLMEARRNYFPGLPAGFIHVPDAAEYKTGPEKPALPLAVIAHGLEICIRETYT